MQEHLNIVILITAITFYNSLRSRHYLKRQAIVPPQLSSWSYLYKNADESSFLHLTGYSRCAFENLKGILFEGVEYNTTGRPELLDHAGKLGLYLFFVGSTMEIKYLCSQFGILEGTASTIIKSMCELVIKKLKSRPESSITWPNEDKMQEWAELVRLREPLTRNVIGFVDGLALHVQCSEDIEEQAAAHNGHYKDSMCNNVLAFSPEGKVFYAAINYPGSWHDSQVCQKLIALVILTIGIFQLCVDKGFPRSGELFDKFVGPLSNETKQKLSPINRDAIIAQHEIYVSLRQASEWGMRALQGTFSRLKTRLTSDKKKRRDIILSIILLHNFRTHEVGLNQIATVFNPEFFSKN